jgi:hypothetical protein
MGAIRLGAILEEARAALRRKRRPYLLFLKLVGEADTTASRYRYVHRLNREEPGLVRDWACLGRVKLYWVARLGRDDRRRVLSPFSRSRLLAMSEHNFEALARKYVRRRASTPGTEVAAATRRVEATARALRRLRVPPPSPARQKLAASLRLLEGAARRVCQKLK